MKNFKLKKLSFRKKIFIFKYNRLSIFKSNNYIYIQIFSLFDLNIIFTISNLQKYYNKFILLNFGKNKKNICSFLGKCMAFKLLNMGIKFIFFDKSGYKYHGCIKLISVYLKKYGLIF